MLYGKYDYNKILQRWELDENFCNRNNLCISDFEDYVPVSDEDAKNRKYVYIIIRNDITKSQQTVQTAHATIEMMVKHRECVEAHPIVVIVVVRSEFKLKALHEKLPYKHECFFESDLNDEMTCIATIPLDSEERQYFKQYKLFKTSVNVQRFFY